MTQSDNPFKGLQPYEREDSQKLFGRERDLVLVKDRIYSGRTTLLFAGSGVGKTSFLNAKLIPEFEDQYCVFYHNQWAGPAQPLESVKATLKNQLDVSVESPLIETFRRFQVSATETSVADSIDGIRPHSRCLLIFDQFEEIFQYHAYEDYFKQFLSEICEVIRTDDYRVHVVFSMREEFLGELSVFDNLIPDLFGNYYRLKHPDKGAARDIIEGTCALSKTAIDKDKLAQLIRDLSKIDKGAAGGVERSTGSANAAEHLVERDFVIPPFLQVVCQRQWDAEAAKVRDGDGFVFLQHYEPNRAQQILRDFCYEKLATLTLREQNRAAQAFDYLVTKQGAKMAYEFRNLADRMRIRLSRRTLRHALDKLSEPDTRILRKSHGPDKSVWFELYHDIYGRILDDWRETFRQRKQRFLVGASIGSSLLVFALILVTFHWLVYPFRYRRTLNDVQLESPEAYGRAQDAYAALVNTFGYQRMANRMWAAAWERRAHYAETHNKRDEAMISWLSALKFSPNAAEAEEWRLKLAALVNDDYDLLRGRLHHENPIDDSIFSEDGRIVVTKTDDQKIWVWDGLTGNPIGEHSNLTVASAPETKQDANEQNRKSGPIPAAPPTDAATTGASKQEAYKLLAAARHPEFGWLVAVISKSELENLTSESSKTRGGSAELKISILSQHDELLESSPTVQVKLGSRNSNYGAVLSPDGKYLVTTGADHPTPAWKLVDKTFAPFDGLAGVGTISAARFSSDARSLLLKNDKNQLSVWDLESGRLRFPPVTINGLAIFGFSRDGQSFATLARPKDRALIQVWDSVSGASIGTPINEKLPQNYDAIFPDADGNVVLLNRAKAQFRVADIKKGQLRDDSTFNPKGSLLQFSASTETGLDSREKDAQLFQLGRKQPLANLITIEGSLLSATLSQDGKRVVIFTRNDQNKLNELSAPSAQVIQIRDAETGKLLASPISNALASGDAPYAARFDNERDQIEILDVNTGSVTKQWHGPHLYTPFGIFFSSTGKFLCTYSVKPGEMPSKRFFDYLMRNPRESRDFSQNAFFKAVDSVIFEARLDVIQRDTGEAPVPPEDSFSTSFPVFSPDEKFLALQGRVWDLVNKRRLYLPNDFTSNNSFWLSENKLVGTSGRQVRIWSLPSGNLLYSDIETNGECKAVALNQTGQTLLTADANGTENLWTLGNNQISKQLGEVKHGENVWSLRFTKDGNTGIILVGDWLHTIRATDNTYLASYFLGGNWLHQCQSLDGSADHFRCLFQSGENSLRIVDINNGQLNGISPMTGQPDELFDRWEQKLGVEIDSLGRIVPKRAGSKPSSAQD